MNDHELDQALNRWKAPEPSRGFRSRVLARFPTRERPNFSRLLRWALAMAAVLCMLAIGAAQSGKGTLENLGDGLYQLHNNTINWIGDMWVGHIMAAFRNSNPKIYVDGELRPDVEFGGSGVGVWFRLPGEGKYLVALRRTIIEGPVPPRAGVFDGHALDFQAGGRHVRIESHGTYGFHEHLPLYVMGPAAGR
uniref:Uncharacterized protein n=1 Tax=Solibacter usitatus (strain Ellin6076) TaxID=234267 RepID=Q01Y80_SOLUE